MERAERAALIIFLFGVSLTMVSVAAPLGYPDAPRVLWQAILFVGMAMASLSLAFLIHEYRDLAKRRRMIPLIGMIVCGIGFAGNALWYFWLLPASQRTSSPSTPPASGAQAPATEAGLASQFNMKILVSCDETALPTTMPQTGTIRTLQLGFAGGGIKGLEGQGPTTQTGTPGQLLKSALDNPHKFGLKCSVQNYAGSPIFNFIAKFKIEEIESVVSVSNPKEGITEGRVINTIEWPIRVEKLGASYPDNSFDVYMWNGNNNIMRIWNPTDAYIQIPGTPNLVFIKLQPSMFAAKSLGPAHDLRKP